jgi:hypothetical protein
MARRAPDKVHERCGAPKAIMALAHHLIVIVYQALSRGEEYVESCSMVARAEPAGAAGRENARGRGAIDGGVRLSWQPAVGSPSDRRGESLRTVATSWSEFRTRRAWYCPVLPSRSTEAEVGGTLALKRLVDTLLLGVRFPELLNPTGASLRFATTRKRLAICASPAGRWHFTQRSPSCRVRCRVEGCWKTGGLGGVSRPNARL